jgi:hypothetical protein
MLYVSRLSEFKNQVSQILDEIQPQICELTHKN